MPRNLACEGCVVHRRGEPVEHQFRYPVWMLCMDVDALDDVPSPLLSSARRWTPLSLRPDDYPRDPRHAPASSGEGIRSRINARIGREGLEPADCVRLLTQPRSWGWLFNPVSFYFCYRDAALHAVVAEITNTPWNEVHSYVLPVAGPAARTEWEFSFPKRFHVSPFMPMDVEYRWRIKLADDAIQIAMRLVKDGQEGFFAGLYLRTAPLTRRALRRGAFRYPLQNLLTLARIYWQALRLWRKGASFHPHPRSVSPGGLDEVRQS